GIRDFHVTGVQTCALPIFIAFDDVDEAVAAVNESAYGLQCGVLSSSLETCMDLARRIRTGGIILGGTSTWRTDQLAYGGVKDSEIGRASCRERVESAGGGA